MIYLTSHKATLPKSKDLSYFMHGYTRMHTCSRASPSPTPLPSTHTYSLWKEKCRECGIDESILKASTRRPSGAIICNPWKQVCTSHCTLVCSLILVQVTKRCKPRLTGNTSCLVACSACVHSIIMVTLGNIVIIRACSGCICHGTCISISLWEFTRVWGI